MFSCVVSTPLSQVFSPKGAVLILDFTKRSWHEAQTRGFILFVTGGWIMAAAVHWRLFAPFCLATEPALCHRSTLLVSRKETKLVGGKYNKTIQHTRKMPRTISFCFKSVSKAHSTPVFIYLHFFSGFNYLCKQKKTCEMMRIQWHLPLF